MKRFALISAAFFTLNSEALADDLVLSEEKVSKYQIVLPDQSLSKEVDAALVQTARLLQTAFEANGADLAVVRESEHRDTKKSPGIFLGNTEFAKKQGIDVTKLEGWGYVHRVVGKTNLIIAGHDHPAPAKSDNPRRPMWDRIGTAKGVTDFLRKYAGVRFLFPDMSFYQPLGKAESIDFLASPAIEFLPMERITIPDDLDVQHTPAILYNTAHPQGCCFYDIANNRFPRVDEIFGGHTWARAVPPEKYRKTNPEYFSLVDGKRLLEGHGQYCLSNPEVQELIYKDLASQLDKGLASVDLGQPDGFRACQCEDCNKLYDTGDNWSEKIWIFNRTMAERLQKSHPGKTVTMMSYIQTAKPPETFKKFPANTRIMLTGTNQSDIDPWQGYEVPDGFAGYLYNWCPNLATRYTPMRTPKFVGDQAKRIAKNRIQGFYRDGSGALFGLEGPVYYTMGRMYDDPEHLFAKDLYSEFIEGAFVESTWHMAQFYNQLYHALELYSDHIGTRCEIWTYEPMEGRRRKTVQDPFQMMAFLYPPKLLANLEEVLSGAEKKARSGKVKARIALVRREFDYVKHFARVVHLHQAYEIQPDLASRDRLLDAIDARNAEIATYFQGRRQTPASEGWAFVMFPPGGHNEAHLRLAHNRYQEPYENTCFNWDTAAMRAAPLPGAKRLSISEIKNGEISLESDHWENAESQTIDASSKFKVLTDNERVYVRVDAENLNSESDVIAVYILPFPGKETAFRFSTGPDSSAKTEAASGFISDVMDPRFAQFDPDWKAAWDCETNVSTDGENWQALFSIPFKALGIEASQTGQFWRANVARIVENNSATWSTVSGTQRPDDLNGFGEWAFGEPKEAKTE